MGLLYHFFVYSVYPPICYTGYGFAHLDSFMNPIILKETGKVIDFTEQDLPMLIHGMSRAGASLFSIAVIANLFLSGKKVLFFTAYPMAKDEFTTQIQGTGKENDVFYLGNTSDIKRASDYEVIIVKSGDSGLCLQTIQMLSDVQERIIFVKNIESILTRELFDSVRKYQSIILSGDLDQISFSSEITKIKFDTKILFSATKVNIHADLPKLEKYTGFMTGNENGLVTLRIS